MTFSSLRQTTWLVLFLFIITSPSLAQQRGQLPNSPRGNALNELLSVVESRDDAVVRSFVRNRLASSLLGQLSEASWMDLLSNVGTSLSEINMRDLAPLGRSGLSVTLYGPATPVEVLVEMQLDQSDPPLFTELKLTERVVDNSPLTLSELGLQAKAFLTDLAGKDEFSGAFALARNGVPLESVFLGSPVQDSDAHLNADTRFNVASMGKMFTAVAIAQLVEAEKLSYSDVVSRHFPEFPWEDYADKITIDQLLTHRSGLGNYDFEHGQTDVEKVVALASSEPVAFEPGSRMAYSNTGYAVLGVIIERVSGMNYHRYIEKNVFERAKMNRSGFFSPLDPVDNMAMGYTRPRTEEAGNGKGRIRNDAMIERIGSPGGGAYSTINDMIQFGEALLSNQLLSGRSTEILWEGRSPMGPDLQYAYGFGNSTRDGVQSIGHNGGAPGIGADFRIYPELNLISIAFTNFDPDPIMPFSSYLNKLLSRLSN